MEAYRSGHNGHDWKSCSLHGLRGSNPLASAKQNEQANFCLFVLFWRWWKGIRTGWESACKRYNKQQQKQADQTTDETVVCNPGVIATLWQKMSVKIKWNLKQVIIWMSRSESPRFRQMNLSWTRKKVKVRILFFTHNTGSNHKRIAIEIWTRTIIFYAIYG